MSAYTNASMLLGGLATSLLLGAFAPLPAVAQPPLDRTQLPIPTAPFDGVANRTLEGSKPDWPRPIAAPDGAPNVLLILIDDAGFGSRRCRASAVPTDDTKAGRLPRDRPR